MKKVGTQGRIIKVYEMLKQESDENHALSTNDIIDKLAEIDISADRRTIYSDIIELNNMGYEVLTKKGANQRNLYYVMDRNFDATELGILIDAVEAASFITEKKTKVLIGKIASLGGSLQGEIIKNNKVDFNTTKHSNEEIFYNIDNIQNAITDKKKIAFQYFDLDSHCQKQFRKNGEKYVVSPVAMVMNNDNYYFYGYHKNHGNTATYRIDRMVKVETLKDNIDEEAIELKNKVSQNRKQAFGMFSGDEKVVTFLFDKKLIDVMFDRFGENIIIEQEGELMKCTQRVMVSDQFFGWCCSFNKQLKIVNPSSVVEGLKQYIRHIASNYQEN